MCPPLSIHLERPARHPNVTNRREHTVFIVRLPRCSQTHHRRPTWTIFWSWFGALSERRSFSRGGRSYRRWQTRRSRRFSKFKRKGPSDHCLQSSQKQGPCDPKGHDPDRTTNIFNARASGGDGGVGAADSSKRFRTERERGGLTEVFSCTCITAPVPFVGATARYRRKAWAAAPSGHAGDVPLARRCLSRAESGEPRPSRSETERSADDPTRGRDHRRGELGVQREAVWGQARSHGQQ